MKYTDIRQCTASYSVAPISISNKCDKLNPTLRTHCTFYVTFVVIYIQYNIVTVGLKPQNCHFTETNTPNNVFNY